MDQINKPQLSHRRKNSEKSDDEPLNFDGLDDDDMG